MTTQTLHRFLLNPPPNMVVDFINHNGLDCRLENLRLCTRLEVLVLNVSLKYFE
jgi:hypothetical protein